MGKRRLCTVCTLFVSPVVSAYFCVDLRTHRRALLPYWRCPKSDATGRAKLYCRLYGILWVSYARILSQALLKLQDAILSSSSMVGRLALPTSKETSLPTCSVPQNERTKTCTENCLEFNGEAINMSTTQYIASACISLTKPIVLRGSRSCVWNQIKSYVLTNVSTLYVPVLAFGISIRTLPWW